jgi:hypothetical protein
MGIHSVALAVIAAEGRLDGRAEVVAAGLAAEVVAAGLAAEAVAKHHRFAVGQASMSYSVG